MQNHKNININNSKKKLKYIINFNLIFIFINIFKNVTIYKQFYALKNFYFLIKTFIFKDLNI